MKWKVVERRIDGDAYISPDKKLFVIKSVAEELDGIRWIHLSVSRANKMPSYEDLVLVKAIFIGPNRHAYQCFVPPDEHVNICDRVLHLWAREDGQRMLPDFTRGSGSI